jgi:hypothetical protein
MSHYIIAIIILILGLGSTNEWSQAVFDLSVR